MIANKTVPPVAVATELRRVDGAECQVVRVPQSAAVVATASGRMVRRRLKADGTPENVPMYPFEITHRLSGLKQFDLTSEAVPGAARADLDPLERERLRGVVRVNRGEPGLLDLDDEELDLSLRLARTVLGEVVPTYAGLLLIGRVDRLAELVPTAEAAVQVRSGTALSVNDGFVRPVLASIEAIAECFRSWNRESETEVGLVRVPIPAIDPTAFREALVNAFAHRDYSLMGRVRVQLDDEGATFSNPGGFVEGLTADNLLQAEPQGRNPALADALKRIGLAERTGRGVDRIFAGSLAYGRLLPDYHASNPKTVNLFIPSGRADVGFMELVRTAERRRGSGFSVVQLMILHRLRHSASLALAALAELVGDATRATAAVDSLVAEGLVDESRSRYRLAGAAAPSRPPVRPGAGSAQARQTVLALAAQGAVTRAQAGAATGLNPDQAYRLLRQLAAEGLLRREGRGRSAAYRLTAAETAGA
jgi:ATP-dependent DNA helicase RecG